jgi:hypothetical protein
VDYALASSVLSPDELALFRRMRRSEQLHSLNVLRTVQAAGGTDPALLVAALLHDVGKTVAPFYFLERVLVVLTRKFAPAAYHRWGQAEPRGWRRPFAIAVRHPEWSAQLLREAGSSPRCVELALRHQEHVNDPPQNEVERLLLALKVADEAN